MRKILIFLLMFPAMAKSQVVITTTTITPLTLSVTDYIKANATVDQKGNILYLKGNTTELVKALIVYIKNLENILRSSGIPVPR